MLRIRIQNGGKTLLGPGRADLLEGIVASGSIAAAGRAMGMSYKRAWALVEAINAAFAEPLVTAAKGGAGGGGAMLTPNGHAILAAYRQIEAEAAAASHVPLQTISARAVPPAKESD